MEHLWDLVKHKTGNNIILIIWDRIYDNYMIKENISAEHLRSHTLKHSTSINPSI